jgi:hypothetical protein
MNCSLLPQSPLLWKGCLLCEKPPLGALSLNGHKKLLASLKCGPTVYIWLTKSSTQTIPCLPKACSMTALLVKGILCLLTLPKPLLRISFLIVYLVGYPKVIYGSTLLMRLIEALFTLTKAPLCNCLNLKILKILTDLGFNLLTPRILTINANLGSAGT